MTSGKDFARAFANKMTEENKRTFSKHNWQDHWLRRIKEECDRLNAGLDPQDVMDEIKNVLREMGDE